MVESGTGGGEISDEFESREFSKILLENILLGYIQGKTIRFFVYFRQHECNFLLCLSRWMFCIEIWCSSPFDV